MTHDRGQTGARAHEVAEYVEAVRRSLGDLPPEVRDELLEDLPAHLTEVAAEDDSPLVHRLGSPQAYAADLRATLEPGTGRTGGTLVAHLVARWQWARQALRRLDARVGPILGYAKASDFGRLLVPAWWVLRGYLATMLVIAVFSGFDDVGLLPRWSGSVLAGLVMLAGFVVGSIWLARRTPRLEVWPRRALHAGSALVVLFGLVAFIQIESMTPPRARYYIETEYNPYESVADVYVVDEYGNLLTDVRLFDQNGDPIDIGWDRCEDDGRLEYDREGEPILTYPRCPVALPWGPLPGRPSATPTPTPSAAPSPRPTPSAGTTPTVAPSPVAGSPSPPARSPDPTPNP